MRHRRAFTLIELLLVVAIIGILAGLVLAVTQSIRTSARAVECASNLSHLGLSLVAFSIETQGRIPPPNIDNNVFNNLDGTGRKDADVVPDKGNWWGFLRRYMDEVELSNVFVCPDGNWSKKELRDIQSNVGAEPDAFMRACRWYNSSYGYNRHLGEFADAVFPGENRAWMSWRLSKIPRPNEVPAIVEFWSLAFEGGRKTPTQQPYFTGWVSPVSGSGNRADFDGWKETAVRLSHRNKANHVFYDGHVSSHHPYEMRPEDNAQFYFAATNAYRAKF